MLGNLLVLLLAILGLSDVASSTSHLVRHRRRALKPEEGPAYRGGSSTAGGMGTDHLPILDSKSQTFRIPVGEGVVLPCQVQYLGDHVIVWRKATEVLSAGDMLVSRDPRFRLHPASHRMELKHIRPQDAGDYVCQISILGEALEVAHTVEVMVPPRVKPRPSDGNIVVKKGTEVSLECDASGNPVPKISWTREHDHLPEGSVSGANNQGYTIRQVSRFDAGRYACTADNGVGMPAKAFVSLQVLYEPEIEVEAEKVHSGLGKEAHLTCIVHGEPRPLVRWYKENLELTPNSKVRMEHKEPSSRHTLVLRGLANQRDFGNYSCVAENSLGSSKRHIEVHGRPTPAVFRSKPHQNTHASGGGGNGRNSFRLVWTVDSYTRIEEYRLLYRQIKPFHPDDGHEYGHAVVGGSDWTNIIIPGDAMSSNEFHHEKTFLLTDLVADAQYECLVQAKNRYGWSEASRIHRFYTHFRQEPEARDLGWTTGSTSGAASTSSPHLGLAHLKSVLCFALAAILVPHLGAGGRILFSSHQ